jgi:hypothetical protein
MPRTVLGSGGRYRYKGNNGYLGYKRNGVYRLWITYDHFTPGERSKTGVTIERSGWQRIFRGPGRFVYGNQDLFFSDWEIL